MSRKFGMSKLESKIQKEILDWLESIGCKVIKLVVANKSGNADVIICYKGYYLEFELKQVGEEPTKLQCIKGKMTLDAEGQWFAIHSLDEAKEAIAFVNKIKGVTYE